VPNGAPFLIRRFVMGGFQNPYMVMALVGLAILIGGYMLVRIVGSLDKEENKDGK
jgi:hypothetical protein